MNKKSISERIIPSEGLSAPGWLTEHPGAVLILMALGILIFGILAYEVKTDGPMIQWDNQLAARLHSIAVKLPPSINEIMTFGFFLGKQDMQILGAILVVYFLYKRFWPEVGMVLIGWVGGSIIWSQLIQYFNRVRPEQQVGIEVRIPSFPSGHSMFAVLALGLLAYMLLPKMPSLFWKWVIVVAAIFTILFIGFSRMLQGNHYPSDILAGYAFGVIWGTLVYTLIERIATERKFNTGKNTGLLSCRISFLPRPLKFQVENYIHLGEHMTTNQKREASIPNPALKPFSVLIGNWITVGTHPLVPDTVFHGHTSFEWLEGGAFLMMHSEIDEPGIPTGIAIFSSDDSMDEYFMLYFDERGVSRKYQVTLRDNIWKWWRNSPDFSQRFTCTIVDDGNTIISKGEFSRDGSLWKKDLELTYKKAK